MGNGDRPGCGDDPRAAPESKSLLRSHIHTALGVPLPGRPCTLHGGPPLLRRCPAAASPPPPSKGGFLVALHITLVPPPAVTCPHVHLPTGRPLYTVWTVRPVRTEAAPPAHSCPLASVTVLTDARPHRGSEQLTPSLAFLCERGDCHSQRGEACGARCEHVPIQSLNNAP